MRFFVYILFSAEKNKYYVGYTENLDARINDHRIRKNLGASDWELKHTESFESRSDAMKREYEIKAKKKRSYIESLIKN